VNSKLPLGRASAIWNGSPVNSLIIGLALLLMMPGIATPAVLRSKSTLRSIGRNNVAQNFEHVDAKTAKRLLNGTHASPEMIVSSAIRCASTARSSITIWRLPFPSLISPGHL
jgi:hypothetical protein